MSNHNSPIPSQIRIRCRRGMLELDLLLQNYLNQYYNRASQTEKRQFLQLLEMGDPELYLILTRAAPSPPSLAPVVEKITTRHLQ